MRVLVTGGAGYIGAVMTEQVVQEGHRVTILDVRFVSEAEPGWELQHQNLEDIARSAWARAHSHPHGYSGNPAHDKVNT